MIKLHARIRQRWNEEPFVVRVVSSPQRPVAIRHKEALLLNGQPAVNADGFRLYMNASGSHAVPSNPENGGSPTIDLPKSLDYLMDGDIIRVSPATGHISVLYRRCSNDNTIFLTGRCNCECIMCPQPPRDIPDHFWGEVWAEAIPLMSPDTPALGITGGEPTLAHEELLRLVLTCRNYLPNTYLHILSNGRMFNYMRLCQDLARIKHPNLLTGIGLYSDLAWHHDFIVGAEEAFDQTIRGIINLRRCGLRVELRVVLMQQTVERLVRLAKFIGDNLPFVDHVALMGLEPIGYARRNLEELWIDPADYQQTLVEAVNVLRSRPVKVSLYNQQLCVLDQTLWPLARQSISDWKCEYLPICQKCTVRTKCGGFFFSEKNYHSRKIYPIQGSD